MNFSGPTALTEAYMDTDHKPASEGKFSFQSAQEGEALAGYLRALADGFASGSMRFSRKDLDLVLSPKGLVGFAVEAKGQDGRMKLSLKFSWRESVEKEADDELSITAAAKD